MGIRKGQILELEITDIAFGGRGLARVDGLAVFVEPAVPGDRVRVRITRKKKSYAEARVLELLEASDDRLDPPCPYSGICGGCKWQFLDYERQVEYKRRHVRESLEHIGGIHDPVVHPTICSPRRFGYRNKMEFSCTDRRWLLPAELGQEGIDTGFALGLHVPGTFYKVLDIHACLLQPEDGNAILEAARRSIRTSTRPPYGLRTHEGFWRFLVLRHSVAGDCWLVNLVTAEEDLTAVRAVAEDLTAACPRIAVVVNNITARKAAVAVGEREVHLAGRQTLTEQIDSYRFRISANSFFQTNTETARLLYRTVRDYAALEGTERVLDLYSGTGTIPILLADRAREVVGLEIVPAAVEDALGNCRRNGISNCRFVAGEIRETLSALEIRPEVVVIDPPRDGMHKDVVRQVLELDAARIVYVSCNPATLARDLAILTERYRLLEVQPVDMFPHTFHIESVARLEAR